MTEDFGAVVERIAAFTSIGRSRRADAERREVTGDLELLEAKAEQAASKLRKIADDLEKAIG